MKQLTTIFAILVGFTMNAQLGSVTENSKTGQRLTVSIAANHGDIGSNAVDLSYSECVAAQEVLLVQRPLQWGINTTASGNASTAMGESTTASGGFSTAIGAEYNRLWLCHCNGRYNRSGWVCNGHIRLW